MSTPTPKSLVKLTDHAHAPHSNQTAEKHSPEYDPSLRWEVYASLPTPDTPTLFMRGAQEEGKRSDPSHSEYLFIGNLDFHQVNHYEEISGDPNGLHPGVTPTPHSAGAKPAARVLRFTKQLDKLLSAFPDISTWDVRNLVTVLGEISPVIVTLEKDDDLKRIDDIFPRILQRIFEPRTFSSGQHRLPCRVGGSV